MVLGIVALQAVNHSSQVSLGEAVCFECNGVYAAVIYDIIISSSKSR